MSKKSIIILSSVIFIAVIAAGVFWAFQQGYLFKKEVVLTPAKLLASFEIKNSSLTPEVRQLFQQRFEETKVKLQGDPEIFSEWLYLGVLKKGIGDYEGARDVFIYAGQLRPQSSTPFANLADLYTYFLNDPSKAEENIKKAIANDPNDYNLYLSLADIYRYKFSERQGAYEQTMLDAIAKFPDNANLIAPLAGYFRDTNQTAKAIEWYEKLVKLLPDNEEAKKDLAELEGKQSK
ncbi:MAG: hypothetical protein V1846_01285 [Candidatus Komeilibacteria bacterium]